MAAARKKGARESISKAEKLRRAHEHNLDPTRKTPIPAGKKPPTPEEEAAESTANEKNVPGAKKSKPSKMGRVGKK